MDEMGSRYLITDYQITSTRYKFHAPVTLSGHELGDFYDFFLVGREENKPEIRQLWFPNYYRSLSVRLHNFAGEAVTPEETIVVEWEWTRIGENVLKEIIDLESFPTYEEASAFIAGQESGNYQVASPNPFASPVPLEKLENFDLVHNSGDIGGGIPAIRVFEYVE
jgi:hypothetical protein